MSAFQEPLDTGISEVFTNEKFIYRTNKSREFGHKLRWDGVVISSLGAFSGNMSMIEMFVAGIALDARNGHPIVVLNDSTKRRALPIWIGMAEANAITRALDNVKPERPMTHDLLLSVITQLGYKVKQVEINELAANTYFATILLLVDDPDHKLDTTKSIDARPSDAIGLALRAKCAIFVSAQVVADGTIPADFEKDEAEAQEFKKFIEGLKASDFKKGGGPSE